ncbi:MAG TPA: Crp/Fnr family transcriptional regulator [Acidimicrobiia bacterium]|nr:Crp/Fnr family transcriptional regulator [Acidimicrobiia bacterium]
MARTDDAGSDSFVGRLSESERADLLGAGHSRTYARGSRLFHEGDRSNFVAVIVKGRVKIVTTSESGDEGLLSVRGPGALVGEFAAIDDAPRLAGAVALDRLTAVVLTAEEFRRFLGRHPSAALGLVRTLVGRLRESDRRRVEFGAYDVTRRLAALLVELGAQSTDTANRPTVGLSQQELAGMIGASRESVARALTTLREQGIVGTGRRSITVLDVEALRATI